MLKKFLKDQRGLTLVELLAVIVILGIVSSIAVVSIGNVIHNTRVDAVHADAIQILNAAELYVAQNGNENATINSADLEDFLSQQGSFEGIDWTVTLNENGNTIRATGVEVGSRDMTITFENATIAQINEASRTQTTIPGNADDNGNNGENGVD